VVREVVSKLIEHGPEIVKELMGPVSAISDIKVLQVQGLSGGAGTNGSPVGGVLKTLLDASALAPVMKSMLDFGGMSPEKLAEKAKDLLRPPNVAAPQVPGASAKAEGKNAGGFSDIDLVEEEPATRPPGALPSFSAEEASK
jgi:hypothetical protein